MSNVLPNADYILSVEGMHCGACVRRVSQVLSALASATGTFEVAEVGIGTARLRSTDDTSPVEVALAALAKAGYPAHRES